MERAKESELKCQRNKKSLLFFFVINLFILPSFVLNEWCISKLGKKEKRENTNNLRCLCSHFMGLSLHRCGVTHSASGLQLAWHGDHQLILELVQYQQSNANHKNM
jgi:hypothetical protein